MKLFHTSTIAAAFMLAVVSVAPSAAIDGSINFGPHAERPVFMKAFDLELEALVSGTELYDGGNAEGPTRVSVMGSAADGRPDPDTEVVLSRGNQLMGGWTEYTLASARRMSGRVWICVELANGFTVDGAGRPALRLDPEGPAANRHEPALSAHPNPFNPRTQISFRLDVAGHVRLRVFDVRGRLVASLLDQGMPAGRQEFVWDAQGGDSESLPSGVYFVTLDLPGERIVERVALVR